jgi:pimeloyl-ACP methyl ester carboxylesterase
MRTRRALPIVLVLLATGIACARSGSNGTADDLEQTPRVAEEDVTFQTSDGVELAGRLFGDGATAVVIAHMFPAEGASSWYPAARRIAAAGFRAFPFSFRGYEGSGGRRDADRIVEDVEAAFAFLREKGFENIALVGASMGATACLVAAASLDVPAVVTVSATAQFSGVDAEAAASDVDTPVLLIAAQGDDPAYEGLQVLNRVLPDVETKVFEGDAHGTNLLEDRPEAVDEIVAFLRLHTTGAEAAR